MHRKKLWIASGVLLVYILVSQIIFRPASEQGTGLPRSFWIAIDTIGTGVTFCLFAVVPTAALSIIPFKSWSFGAKFKALLPIIAFIVLLVYAIVFGYIDYLKHFKNQEIGQL